MPAALPVVINRTGGTAAALGDDLEATVRKAFSRKIALELVDGAAVGKAVARHRDAPVIVIGGGDGSLGAAAAELVDARASLAILPLGTRNHFARQLGIPLDLAEAAAVAQRGVHRQVDLGCANGRVFINNASLGVYVKLVQERDARRGPKWLRTLPALGAVLRHMNAQRLQARIDGQMRQLDTPLLFIGNNLYSLKRATLGQRQSLSDGVLSVGAVARKSPAELISLGLRMVTGFNSEDHDFEELAAVRKLTLEGSGSVHIAFDGEVEAATLPLDFTILPRALSVVVPENDTQRRSQ